MTTPRTVACCVAVLSCGVALAQDPAPVPPPAPAPAPAPTPTAGTQDPAPTPAPKPAPQPAPTQTPPAPTPPPIDPTNAAAELLRRRLGLVPGPQGQPPAGPPPTPPPGSTPVPAATAQDPAAPPPATPGQQPQSQQPQSQQTQPQQPAAAVQDPTQQAAEALRRLLPNAKPPEIAPVAGQVNPEPPAPAPRLPEPTASTTLPLQGSLWTRYRARHGGGATDQDVVARLGVDIGRSDKDTVTAHLRARGFLNADGRRRDDPFPGLDQSFGDEWNGRLYAAHVDVHRQGALELARLGRQDLDETPTTLQFDGLRVDSVRMGASKVWLSAYGGIPVHQFEASRHGDAVLGLAGGFVPWQAARLRFDGMHLRDDYLALDRRDDLLSVRWWQNVGEVQLHGLHTWRDGVPRDLQVGSRGELLAVGWSLDYRELLSTQRQQVTELDPFYTIGFEYSPYRQLDATLRREVLPGVELGVGADLRRLRDEADQSAFNREFERGHVDVTWSDVLLRGLSLSVSGSYWNSSGEDFRTATGELAYRPDNTLRAVIGSSYDLFLYDVFDARERVHVRSYYVRLDRRLGAALRVDGSYELQRDDLDEFHLFRLGMTWTF